MRRKKIVLYRPTASLIYRQGEVPLQLLSIARMHPEYDVHIVCSEIGMTKRPLSEVKAEIAKHLDDCLYFGVTAMTGFGLSEAQAISRWVRSESPDTRIVWGGWHASLLPEQTLKEPEIDFVVVGQGEETARDLVAAFEAGVTDFSAIDGLGWKDNGRMVLNKPRAIADIDQFPPLPWELANIEMFEMNSDERMVGVITSVGCPLDCGFCADRAVYGGKWKRNGVEKTLFELQRLRDDFGVTTVKILDSNFFVDWRRGIEILTGMRELGMRAYWINARIPKLLRVTEEDLALFRDTVDFFLVGAESGSEETLELVTKLQTVDDIERVGRIYGEAGVSVCFSTLVGLPYDDAEMWKKELDLTLSMIDRLLKSSKFTHTAQVHVYTPYPGTPLFAKAVELGFKPPTDLEGWSKIEMFATKLPYLPDDICVKAEFITTHILQLMRPDYTFYQGRNIAAKVLMNGLQELLTLFYRARWKAKYFDHPFEMRLIEKILSPPHKVKTDPEPLKA